MARKSNSDRTLDGHKQREVAKLAGVCPGTVWGYVNRKGGAGKHTEKAILDAINELNRRKLASLLEQKRLLIKEIDSLNSKIENYEHDNGPECEAEPETDISGRS